MSNVVAALLILICSSVAFAEKVNGRFELGGLMQTEKFNNNLGGSNSNDSEFFTFRSFLNVSEIGREKLEFNSDIRDKYDEYDKLDTQDLKLTPENVFQVQQLNIRKPVFGDTGFGYTAGRTYVPEAGGAYVDGFIGHYKFRSDFDLGEFAGLNPKLAGQPVTNWNPNSFTNGTFLSYMPKSLEWSKSFYLTHAIVVQSDEGHTDRTYLFHNMSYQWSANGRLITFLFLDFVPRTYVQEGSVYWQHEYSNTIYGKLTAMGVDSIGYVHIQGALEQLTPSPYKQLVYAVDLHRTPLVTWELSALYGYRSFDELSKKEVAVSMADQRSFGPNWDTSFTFGYRDNFVSDDEFGRVQFGYFSRAWESYLNIEAAVQHYRNQTYTVMPAAEAAFNTNTPYTNKHPLTAEIGVSHFFNKALYLTWSLERASNEDVTILSTFFKLGYRYGNREIPPLRDGSPVKGTL